MNADEKKVKIAFIDPWGVNGAERYLNGEISGLSNFCDITLYTNYYYTTISSIQYRVKKVFFRKMNSNSKKVHKFA